jgi:hypothetical protein
MYLTESLIAAGAGIGHAGMCVPAALCNPLKWCDAYAAATSVITELNVTGQSVHDRDMPGSGEVADWLMAADCKSVSNGNPGHWSA